MTARSIYANINNYAKYLDFQNSALLQTQFYDISISVFEIIAMTNIRMKSRKLNRK